MASAGGYTVGAEPGALCRIFTASATAARGGDMYARTGPAGRPRQGALCGSRGAGKSGVGRPPASLRIVGPSNGVVTKTDS